MAKGIDIVSRTYMAWRRFRRDPVAFPTPCPTRDVFYPQFYPDFRRYPHRFEERTPREDQPWRKVDAIADFLDDKIAFSGDLGWTLDYATAWCYRHLIGSQPEVADAIDHVRELGTVSPKTPYYIFNYLDKAIFGGKLQDMVYLRWRSQSSCSPGTTSAPNVEGIPRICVELNKTPFEDDAADIDDLLEALIHQMIHAYFLVCCGAQKKDDYQDGRLMDGLHFGVILLTIKDISKQCVDGVLSLVFHAYKRREFEGRLPLRPANILCNPMPASNSKSTYISLDPRGNAIGPAAADGQTHCMHDNRKISWQQIKNWQVETFARAIDLQMDLKGIDIWDLDTEGVLTRHSRLQVDPSTTYVELLWDEKRIMVPREKCLKFPSLSRPITKLGQFDLMLPECDEDTFKCIYDHITQGTYKTCHWNMFRNGIALAKGPPVYMPPTESGESTGEYPSIIASIKVFKAAEQMKFEELQFHAMEQLFNADMTSDNPIQAFELLYNDNDPDVGPISAELHKWARKFMVKKDDGRADAGRQECVCRHHHRGLDSFWDQDSHAAVNHDQHRRGMSNYEKMLVFHGPAFEELYTRSAAFRDDADIAKNELVLAGELGYDAPRSWDSTPSLSSGFSSFSSLSSLGGMHQPGLRLPHRRSWSSCGGQMGAAWPGPRLQHSLDDLAIPPTHARPLAVPRLLQRRLVDVREKIGRAPVHQWREDFGLLGRRRW